MSWLNTSAGLDRYENSGEHSWQLALLALSLERFAESPVDMKRVVHRIKTPIQAGGPALWEYLEARLEEARNRGLFGA